MMVMKQFLLGVVVATVVWGIIITAVAMTTPPQQRLEPIATATSEITIIRKVPPPILREWLFLHPEEAAPPTGWGPGQVVPVVDKVIEPAPVTQPQQQVCDKRTFWYRGALRWYCKR